MFCAVELSAQNFNVSYDLSKCVEYLCSEPLAGRKAGSDGERAAASYIYHSLEDAGVVMLTDSNGQDFSIQSGDSAIFSRNIVGIVQGADPKLRDEYIVVGAHYDHMGVNTLTIDGVQTAQLYPGAGSNASGVAVMLSLAKMIADCQFLFSRSIVFVAFGAGECGYAGSWYFANRAFEQMGRVKAMVNLDMLGRSGDGNKFEAFSQMDEEDYWRLADLTSDEPVVIRPEKASAQIIPSDFLPFYEKEIPVVSFTTGTYRERNTVRDVPGLLDYDQMERICNYIYHFLKVYSNEEIMPVIGKSSEDGTRPAHEGRIYSYADCDIKPQFFHSDERHFLDSWVYKYVKYPEYAITSGIQGEVIVSFIIEKNGQVTNVKIENELDESLEEEVIRVVSASPKWIPGKIGGNKVRTRIVLPVEFRLKSDAPGHKYRFFRIKR